MGQACVRSTLIQKFPNSENDPTAANGVYVPSTNHRSFPHETRSRSESNIREAGVSSAFTPAAIALWEKQHKKKWEEDVIPSQTEDQCDNTSIVSREEAIPLDNLTPLGHLHKQPSSSLFAPEEVSEMSAMDAPDRRQQQTPSGNIIPLWVVVKTFCTHSQYGVFLLYTHISSNT